jgi:hypothetical protein
MDLVYAVWLQVGDYEPRAKALCVILKKGQLQLEATLKP